MGHMNEPDHPVVVTEVFGPERVDALRARLADGGDPPTGDELGDLLDTLDGLWGLAVRDTSGFEPLLGTCYGVTNRHWYRRAVTSGPPSIHCDEAYAEMTGNEELVLAHSRRLSGTLPSFPEPPEWADLYQDED
jgi:hypothetical protein